MYVNHEECILSFQKRLLGRFLDPEILCSKMSDTPEEVRYIWKATEIRLGKKGMSV